MLPCTDWNDENAGVVAVIERGFADECVSSGREYGTSPLGAHGHHHQVQNGRLYTYVTKIQKIRH